MELGGEREVTWREGVLDYGQITELRAQLRQGRRDTLYPLFAIIMFDVWWRRYVAGTVPA